MRRNLRAFVIGTAMIAVISAAVMTLLHFGMPADIGIAMWGALVVAGFVTAVLAADRKLLLATLLVVPAAVIFVVENALWQLAGKPADHIGVKGAIIVLLMSVPFGAVLCSLGGVVGWIVTRGSTHNKPLQPIARENARSG
jgi:hypothetical protein